MVDGDKLGDVGFQKLGTPYSEMDCQAFVEWCLRQCGMNKDLAGSNAWFREVYKNGVIMTPEECVKELGTVPKGAFLFILEHDGKEPEKYKPDGLGNASHIGICTQPRGEGAIHSSASRGCVAESKFKNKTINGGWNRVGLWNQVAYDYGGGGYTPAPEPDPEQAPEPEPEPIPEPVTAYVTSENGKPVNTRKGPGKNYAQSLAGKLEVGTEVEILERRGEWDQIRVRQNGVNRVCWMMDHYLQAEEPDPVPADPLYTVIIEHLQKNRAEMIIGAYGGTMKKEGD